MHSPALAILPKFLSECGHCLRQAVASLLIVSLACSGTPQVIRQGWNDAVAQEDTKYLGANTAEYEVCEIPPSAPGLQPVHVDPEEFKRAVARLARGMPLSGDPRGVAQFLFGVEREVEFLAQMQGERLVLLQPLRERRLPGSPAEVALTRQYQDYCSQTGGGGDCLLLLGDAPVIQGEDKYTLALAFAFGSVLDEIRSNVQEQLNPQAVLSMIMGAAVLYMMLWVVPEPVSKLLAAAITVVLLAWLTQDTVNSLISGWEQLVEEADRATTLQQLREAGGRFSQVMGKNTARVLVLAILAVMGGVTARAAERLATLPGFARAAVAAEAQGIRLSAVAEVEEAAISAEGGFSLLMRVRRSLRGGGSVQGSSSITTAIRHRGGNRQVVLGNGQRWHVPANKSLQDIPKSDPLGDQLQAAATQAAKQWGPDKLTNAERNIINDALARGKSWLARRWEAQARGRWVEGVVKQQFQRLLRWNQKGVDAVDPKGYSYEILSGTHKNMAQHGRRMSDVLFRMITF